MTLQVRESFLTSDPKQQSDTQGGCHTAAHMLENRFIYIYIYINHERNPVYVS
jgi:hypothetical protein